MMRFTLIIAWIVAGLLFVSGCATGGEPAATVSARDAVTNGTAANLGATGLAQTAVVQTPQTVDREANADVLYVVARKEPGGTWHFSVTVAHPDTGWEDYANGWDVLLADGEVAKPDSESPFTRLLLHPHENEQPFTRGQGGIEIPQGVTSVLVRAHDLVDGFGGKEIVVDLTTDKGPGYEVQR